MGRHCWLVQQRKLIELYKTLPDKLAVAPGIGNRLGTSGSNPQHLGPLPSLSRQERGFKSPSPDGRGYGEGDFRASLL